MSLRCSLILLSEAQQKRPVRMSALKDQLAVLNEELKASKEQLNLSLSLKKMFQQEAYKVKKKLAAMPKKLEKIEKQLLESLDSELHKISQDRIENGNLNVRLYKSSVNVK